MHPEVGAYLVVERAVRGRRRALQLLGLTGGLLSGLILKGLAHRFLGPGFEPHWGGAIELSCWVAPVPAALSGARRLHERWIRVRGPVLLARVAAASQLDASTLGEALEA